MDKEIVESKINVLAFGNEKMHEVLDLVYRLGKPIIDKWPDENADKVAQRLIWATGCVIRRRIKYGELVVKGEKYWDGENGKKVNASLVDYIEARDKR